MIQVHYASRVILAYKFIALHLLLYLKRWTLITKMEDARNANRADGENEGNEDYGNQEFDGNVAEEEIGMQE